MSTGPERSEDFFTPQELEAVELDVDTLRLVLDGVKHIAAGYDMSLATEPAPKSSIAKATRIGRREGRTEAVERVSSMLLFLFDRAEE